MDRQRTGALAVKGTDRFDALAHARHGDPFSILGPHNEAGTLIVRTFQPAAERVSVVRATEAVEMTRVHPSGIFEARFVEGDTSTDYRLRVVYPGGYATEIDDPYRYGRVVS